RFTMKRKTGAGNLFLVAATLCLWHQVYSLQLERLSGNQLEELSLREPRQPQYGWGTWRVRYSRGPGQPGRCCFQEALSPSKNYRKILMINKT
ncbi:unnamed protein product, partial [Candidula unifasciata]